MDRYRRHQNQDFATEIYSLMQPDGEISDSSSSDASSCPEQRGRNIYMHIWLGSELGHQPLSGLTTDNPAFLAERFLIKHNLPMTALEELKQMVIQKIKEFNC